MQRPGHTGRKTLAKKKSNLAEEWPLVKIDLILNKAETYYVSWRRFLYLNQKKAVQVHLIGAKPIVQVKR